MEEGLIDGSLLKTLRKYYAGDALAEKLLGNRNSSRRVEAAEAGSPVFFVDGDDVIRYGMESNKEQPFYVPLALRESVLFTYHGMPMLGHLGTEKVWPILRRHFYWPKIRTNLKRWISACLLSAEEAPRRMRQGVSSPLEQASKPFQYLSFDLVGPYEETEQGNTVILTALCNFTRFAFCDTVARW